MYIGEYFPIAIPPEPLNQYELMTAAWGYGSARVVLLWRQGENNKLEAVYTAHPTEEGKIIHKTVIAMNAVGTIVYHPQIARYCTMVKINDMYWVVGINCGG